MRRKNEKEEWEGRREMKNEGRNKKDEWHWEGKTGGKTGMEYLRGIMRRKTGKEEREGRMGMKNEREEWEGGLRGKDERGEKNSIPRKSTDPASKKSPRENQQTPT